ncbi:MAG: hypothetical protein PUB69_03150 [Desulfovibrionaceae bacterium]|nr:hypothetical protein [Desulfovibrionaceae bacterium]
MVKTKAACLLPVVAGMLVVSGCGEQASFHETWKSTKSLYAEYLNPPAEIDYQDKSPLTEVQTRLALAMVGVDIRLEALERVLLNADKPNDELVASIFRRFSWISGVAAIDALGTVLARAPETYIKDLDFSALIEQKPVGTDLRGVRGWVQDTPFGAEVFLASPVYNNMDLMGMLIVHFDMQSLLRDAGCDDSIVAVAPQGILCRGRFNDTLPVFSENWEKILKDNVSGSVGSSPSRFYWMSRFIGRQPLVFAMSENPDEVSLLKESEGNTDSVLSDAVPSEDEMRAAEQEENHSDEGLPSVPPALKSIYF